MSAGDAFGCSSCGGNTVPDGARCPWCWRGFPGTYRETLLAAYARALQSLEPAPSSCWTDPTTRLRLPQAPGSGRAYIVTPLRVEWDARGEMEG